MLSKLKKKILMNFLVFDLHLFCFNGNSTLDELQKFD